MDQVLDNAPTWAIALYLILQALVNFGRWLVQHRGGKESERSRCREDLSKLAADARRAAEILSKDDGSGRLLVYSKDTEILAQLREVLARLERIERELYAGEE